MSENENNSITPIGEAIDITKPSPERTKAIKDAALEWILAPLDQRCTKTALAARFGISIQAMSKVIRSTERRTGLAGRKPKLSDDFAAKIRAGDKVAVDNYESIVQAMVKQATKGNAKAAHLLLDKVISVHRAESAVKTPEIVSIAVIQALMVLPTHRDETPREIAARYYRSQGAIEADIPALVEQTFAQRQTMNLPQLPGMSEPDNSADSQGEVVDVEPDVVDFVSQS